MARAILALGQQKFDNAKIFFHFSLFCGCFCRYIALYYHHGRKQFRRVQKEIKMELSVYQFSNYEGMTKENFRSILNIVSEAAENAGLESFASYPESTYEEAIENIDSLRICGLNNDWGDINYEIPKDLLCGLTAETLDALMIDLRSHAVAFANATECEAIIADYERAIDEHCEGEHEN